MPLSSKSRLPQILTEPWGPYEPTLKIVSLLNVFINIVLNFFKTSSEYNFEHNDNILRWNVCLHQKKLHILLYVPFFMRMFFFLLPCLIYSWPTESWSYSIYRFILLLYLLSLHHDVLWACHWILIYLDLVLVFKPFLFLFFSEIVVNNHCEKWWYILKLFVNKCGLLSSYFVLNSTLTLNWF